MGWVGGVWGWVSFGLVVEVLVEGCDSSGCDLRVCVLLGVLSDLEGVLGGWWWCLWVFFMWLDLLVVDICGQLPTFLVESPIGSTLFP